VWLQKVIDIGEQIVKMSFEYCKSYSPKIQLSASNLKGKDRQKNAARNLAA
jgi:hypothetical protein